MEGMGMEMVLGGVDDMGGDFFSREEKERVSMER